MVPSSWCGGDSLSPPDAVELSPALGLFLPIRGAEGCAFFVYDVAFLSGNNFAVFVDWLTAVITSHSSVLLFRPVGLVSRDCIPREAPWRCRPGLKNSCFRLVGVRRRPERNPCLSRPLGLALPPSLTATVGEGCSRGPLFSVGLFGSTDYSIAQTVVGVKGVWARSFLWVLSILLIDRSVVLPSRAWYYRYARGICSPRS